MADDDRGNHRKVYARGFYDGLAAAGGELKSEKIDEKLRGRSMQEQKAFAAVPIQEYWSAAQIGSAIQRSSGSTMDRKTLDGCLLRLKDAGLIQSRADGTFRRVQVRDGEKKEMAENRVPESTGIAPAKTLNPVDNISDPKDTPLDRLAGIATVLRLHGTILHNAAKEVEEIALELEERNEAGDAEVQKLRQLKSILKELA